MVDSFLLSGLGFGCVGLASAQTLVSPRRFVGASYHRISGLFLSIGENLKLGHYRFSLQPSARLCVSLRPKPIQRRGRRDTQRAAEKSETLLVLLS